jgi:diguanylate cyclase (GGDEF)-like protein
LELANAELRRLATTDPLTGAWNRRHFEEVAAVEMARSRRHAQPLALLLFDVDHFKRINDGHGHPAGDRVLVDLVQRVRRLLRAEDVLARWGGEEFIVLMPHARVPDATRLAERLRQGLAQEPFAAVGRVTASFGIAGFLVDEPFDACIRRADAALYLAKRRGRDAVVEAASVVAV